MDVVESVVHILDFQISAHIVVALSVGNTVTAVAVAVDAETALVCLFVVFLTVDMVVAVDTIDTIAIPSVVYVVVSVVNELVVVCAAPVGVLVATCVWDVKGVGI